VTWRSYRITTGSRTVRPWAHDVVVDPSKCHRLHRRAFGGVIAVDQQDALRVRVWFVRARKQIVYHGVVDKEQRYWLLVGPQLREPGECRIRRGCPRRREVVAKPP
jgi:hypothetical protein